MPPPRAYLRSTLLTLLCFAASACSGNQVCEVNEDCREDQVCHIQRCTNKSPRMERPSECGDRCEPGAVACDYRPLSVGTKSCVRTDEGCSRWELGPDCAATDFCQRDEGCKPQLGPGAECLSPHQCAGELSCRDGVCAAPLPAGASCRSDGECTAGMRCAAPGTRDLRCYQACDRGEVCGAGELCAWSVCVPADLCDPCAFGEGRCVGQGADRCEHVNGECLRWARVDTCAGSNVCQSGACVGTVALGGACSSAAYCLPGLVCRTDTSRCVQGCNDSASCGAEACHIIPASRDQGICTAAPGPTVETACELVIGSAVVPGVWDRVILDQTAWPADPYVRVVTPDRELFRTNTFTDNERPTWDLRTPPIPFGTLHFAAVQLWDDDLNIFVGDELIASWRLAEHYDWTNGSTRWPLTLRSGEVSLTVTVECAR